MTDRRCARLLAFPALLAAAVPGSLPAQAYPPPLAAAQAAEVQAAIDSMRRDPRGPFVRISWYCNDSTVHPPQGTPCGERGGGVQHAELSDRARRLAALAVYTGTILQATSFDSLVDAGRAHYRLRELVLQAYLEGVDDGWVLRRARYYRGARQIEDEEQRGREYLQRLLAEPGWTARHFLLADQLVAAVPHVGLGGEQRTHQIRNLASEIAGMDSTFLNLRIKIHSYPGRDDPDTVERFRTTRRRDASVDAKLLELRDLLREQYDVRHSLDLLERFRQRAPPTLRPAVADLAATLRTDALEERLRRLGELSARLRETVEWTADGPTNLVLMDLNRATQELAMVVARDVAAARPEAVQRRRELSTLASYVALAYGAGFLSGRERQALDDALRGLLSHTSVDALGYRQQLQYLAGSLDWAGATVRAVYGPVTDRYAAFEPHAAGFRDALLRGSILLALAEAFERLTADADAQVGTSHVVFGTAVSRGLRGLNPGVALRELAVAADEAAGARADATKIYVMPETTPELRPVAGVLTLGEGNPLSHVQLLARNLGIPNAALSSDLLPRVREAEGDTVFFAVSPLGRVVLQRAGALTEDEWTLVAQGQAAQTERYHLDTEHLRLDVVAPIPLTELRLGHSGVVVGPKAANLGQLGAYFPGRVSRGVALPFGMFARHVDRPFDSERAVLEELQDAYDRAGQMRAAGTGEAEIDRFMFEALARVRRAILELEWQPDVLEAIVAAVRETLGDALANGLFVRSDTNGKTYRSSRAPDST